MNQVIYTSFTKVRRILHVADLHIRLFKRHAEYREAFDTLFTEWEQSDMSDTVIVVAGDIVHSKTELSPEMVDLATYFLKRCAQIAPTLVIAGNHDMNLANKNRMDALTPICENIHETNLYYLKHSGVYTIGDTDFAVMSLLGDESEWPTAADCTAPNKVALFHGPVLSATTDVGYVVESKHYKVEMFDGFDMVLLGDIHRHQTLQPKNPIIAYASSLIQQNHGELPEGHGWCEWDVQNRSFAFHELPNRYGYYTLRIENGEVPDYSRIPSNVRLRIFAGNMEQSEIKKLVTQIRKVTTIEELAITNFTGARSTNRNLAVDALHDLHDVTYQNKLITDYLRTAMPSLDQVVLDRVLELNTRLNNQVVADDLARNIIWKPIRLKFDNLFTYGEGNVIEFDKTKGVAGIFAPNASGKTSVAEAICFALYDRTPRTTKAVSIMNRRKTECYLEFRFDVNGTEYVIERTGKKNKKGEVKIDVDFYKLEKGVKISLNGEERRYTNAEIRKVVGDYEDFILTTFSSSAQTGLFVDRGQSDRKDLLSQFMGLNIFDKLEMLASIESKEIAAAMKRFKSDDFTQELADLDVKIAMSDGALDAYEQEATQYHADLEDVGTQIQERYADKNPVTVKNTNIDALSADYKAAQATERDLKTRLEQFRADHATLTDKLERANVKMTTEYANFERELEEFRVKEREVADFRTKVLHEATTLTRYTEELERLRAHKYDPDCEFCILNGKHTINRMAELQDTLNRLTPVAQDRADKLKRYDEEFAAAKPVMDARIQKYKVGTEFIKQTERKISDIERAMRQDTDKLSEVTIALRDFKQAITEYFNAKDWISFNELIDRQIVKLKEVEAGIKKQLTGLEAQRSTQLTIRATSVQRKNDLLARIQEAEEYESKYEVYEAYLEAVCRDGLPYKLIGEVLPDLEAAVNNILNQMVEFSLRFEMDGKNVNMLLSYDEPRTWPLELASGMEKFISGLAIRVALTSLSSLPKSNFLIIDEGLGALDGDNLSSIFGLFDVLRTQFESIFLISHVDSVKDVADSLIEIQRTDGFSTIKVN